MTGPDSAFEPTAASVPLAVPGFWPSAAAQRDRSRALQRLRQEGLTRHEALHAMGAVLARPIGHVLPSGDEAGDVRGRYAAGLEGLSADSWRQRFAGDEGG